MLSKSSFSSRKPVFSTFSEPRGNDSIYNSHSSFISLHWLIVCDFPYAVKSVNSVIHSRFTSTWYRSNKLLYLLCITACRDKISSNSLFSVLMLQKLGQGASWTWLAKFYNIAITTTQHPISQIQNARPIQHRIFLDKIVDPLIGMYLQKIRSAKDFDTNRRQTTRWRYFS